MGKVAIREYDRSQSIVFLKTNDEFGGLSNMAGGFPLFINESKILTSEALYQACRFPHLPEVQNLIISQASPMTAKMRSKPYRSESRPDWLRARVRIMKWCLRAKLIQNWDGFSRLLLKTEGFPIVEQSSKDKFWGASPSEHNRLVGANVLGRLLMELREDIIGGRLDRYELAPLDLQDFLLYGQPVRSVRLSDVIAMPENRALFD
ncbi:Riboflavin biosynthesis protein [Pseudomonas fluorescens]|nr:Riboflavin biosynthesis protein [Pseudomonas fluorescens]